MCIYVIPPLKINHVAVYNVNSLPFLYYISTVSDRLFPYANRVLLVTLSQYHVPMFVSIQVFFKLFDM